MNTSLPLNLEELSLTDCATGLKIDKVSTEWTGAIPATYVYKRDKSRFIGTSVKSMAELEAAIRSL